MPSNARVSFPITAMALTSFRTCLILPSPNVVWLMVMLFISSMVWRLGGPVQRPNVSRCRWLFPHMISHMLFILRSGFLKEGQLHSLVQAWKWVAMAIVMSMSGGTTVTSWRSLSRSQQARSQFLQLNMPMLVREKTTSDTTQFCFLCYWTCWYIHTLVASKLLLCIVFIIITVITVISCMQDVVLL